MLMYNEQTKAHLIDSLTHFSLLYRSYMFQRQQVILRQLSQGACQVT